MQLHLKEWTRAHELATIALERYRAVMAPTHAALAQVTLAECAQQRGDAALAEELLRGALRAFRSLECVLGEAEAMRMLGTLRLDVGDEIAGRPLLCDAVARYDALEQYGTRSSYGASIALRLLRGVTQPSTANAAAVLDGGDVDGDFTSLLDVGAHRARSRTIGVRAGARLGKVLRRTTRGPTVSQQTKGDSSPQRRNRCTLHCSCWCFQIGVRAGGADGDVGTGDDDEDEDEDGRETRTRMSLWKPSKRRGMRRSSHHRGGCTEVPASTSGTFPGHTN